MHPVHQIVYVLEGTLTVEPEGYPAQVWKAGQAIVEVLNTWHAAYNRGTTPNKVFNIFFGEEGKPVTINP